MHKFLVNFFSVSSRLNNISDYGSQTRVKERNKKDDIVQNIFIQLCQNFCKYFCQLTQTPIFLASSLLYLEGWYTIMNDTNIHH